MFPRTLYGFSDWHKTLYTVVFVHSCLETSDIRHSDLFPQQQWQNKISLCIQVQLDYKHK